MFRRKAIYWRVALLAGVYSIPPMTDPALEEQQQQPVIEPREVDEAIKERERLAAAHVGVQRVAGVPPEKKEKSSTALAEEERRRKLREQQGLCGTCGQKLFDLKSPALFRLTCRKPEDSVQRIPLTIPLLVNQGVCLLCPLSSDNDSMSIQSVEPEPILAQQQPEYFESALPTKCLSTIEEDDSKSVADAKAAEKAARQAAGEPQQTALYQGPLNVTGEKHGEGIMLWDNGDVYQGMFAHGHRHGHGVLTFGGDGEYVGEWLDNRMHGSGTRRYPTGDLYIGEYVQGKREGEGRFYYANGDMYMGLWKNNQMHGLGRYYYDAGQRFEGTFCLGKRVGHGKLQRMDNVLEIFQYLDDERIGKGVRWSADRTEAWILTLPTATHRKMEATPCSVNEALYLVQEIEQATPFEQDMESPFDD